MALLGFIIHAVVLNRRHQYQTISTAVSDQMPPHRQQYHRKRNFVETTFEDI